MNSSRTMVFLVGLLVMCSSAMAAEISGTVYTSGGGVLPRGIGPISIRAIKGDSVHGTMWSGSADVNVTDGTYKITNLPAGLYFLITDGNPAILNECWALPESVPDDWSFCSSGGTPILVAESETVKDRNFYLDIGTGSISGAIYKTDGETPVAGAGSVVYAFQKKEDGTCPEQGPNRQFSVNSDGTYTAQYFPDGEFFLYARAYDFDDTDLKVWWSSTGSEIDCSKATPISIVNGKAVTGKDIVLKTGASISGTIYEKDGSNPITDLFQSVVVFQGDNPCDEAPWVAHNYVSSDGTYKISQLLPGSYYLMVFPFNVSSDHLPDYGGGYWNSSGTAADCSNATPITVTADQAVSGKDFQLAAGAGISGTLYESDGVTPVSLPVYVAIYDRPPCRSNTWLDRKYVYDTNGSFEFNRLKAGQYYMVATRRGYVEQWWTPTTPVSQCEEAIPITVAAGQRVEDRNIIFHQNATITGTVFTGGGTHSVKGKEISVVAVTEDPCSQATDMGFKVGAPIDQVTGTYSISGLTAGTYYLYAWNSFDLEYNDEWWSQSGSTVECSAATPIAVTTPGIIPNIDFKLSYRFARPGDINQDGVIGLNDAVVALQTISGMTEHAVSVSGDVNTDYKVGLAEVVAILNQLAAMSPGD